MAQRLDGTGFSSSPCQTVPNGGRGVGGWVERVFFSQRQHHGIRLRRRDAVHSITVLNLSHVWIWMCRNVHAYQLSTLLYLRLGFPKEWLFDCLGQRGGAKRSIVLIPISVAQLTLLQLAQIWKVIILIQGWVAALLFLFLIPGGEAEYWSRGSKYFSQHMFMIHTMWNYTSCLIYLLGEVLQLRFKSFGPVKSISSCMMSSLRLLGSSSPSGFPEVLLGSSPSSSSAPSCSASSSSRAWDTWLVISGFSSSNGPPFNLQSTAHVPSDWDTSLAAHFKTVL